MCQPKRWWLGVLPLLLVWIALNWFETVPVERDLANRAAAAAGVAGVQAAAVSAAGRDISLAGNAFSDDQRAKAVATVGGLDGVRLVADGLETPAAAKPFIWNAAFSGGKVTLTGLTPSPEARAATVAAATAALPKTEVIDQMTYASGAPATYAAASAFALGQLARLEDGTAAISDESLTIAGHGRTGVNAAAVAAAAGLPAGVALDSKGVISSAISPYPFTATKTEGQIVLSGNYPDEKTHQQILAEAKARFPNETIVDRLALGQGAPAGFGAAVSSGFEQLARLSKGELALRDDSSTLTGEAFYARAADDVKTAFGGGLPNGFKGTANISVATAGAPVDAHACQLQMSDLLSRDTVRFESGKAVLSRQSTALLDHLVAVALRCPTSPIEIDGHTDNVGDPASNEALSKRRAQAVADYLTAAGLDATRLTAAGFGDTRPVASNDTDEGKSKNRRIEFIVK